MTTQAKDLFDESDFFIIEIISIHEMFQNELDKMEELDAASSVLTQL